MVNNDPHKIETKTNESQILLRMENGLQNSAVAYVFICWFDLGKETSPPLKYIFPRWVSPCSWTCWQVGLVVGLAGRLDLQLDLLAGKLNSRLPVLVLVQLLPCSADNEIPAREYAR